MMTDQEYREEAFLAEELAAQEEWFKTKASKNYLARYGDAIAKRVHDLQTKAEQLKNLGQFGSSLVVSVTAIEVIISYYFVKPALLHFAFSDEVRDSILKIILKNNSTTSRDLLPFLLRQYDIELEVGNPDVSIKLPDGTPMWKSFKTINEMRNKIVHAGAPVDSDKALKALECLSVFQNDIVPAFEIWLDHVPGSKWDPYDSLPKDQRDLFGAPPPGNPFAT